MVSSLSTPWPVIDHSFSITLAAAQSRRAEPLGEGGDHTSACPVSEHQCRAAAMLKCSSIVRLSSFVRLTNEVYSYTGWETSEGGRESHNSSRCNKTANICRAASVANKRLPLKERARRLLINGWLRRAGSAGLPAPPSLVLCLQIPSVPDNRQDAPRQLVTPQRSGRSLLSERAV